MGKNSDLEKVNEYDQEYQKKKLAQEAKDRNSWLSHILGKKKKDKNDGKNTKNG